MKPLTHGLSLVVTFLLAASDATSQSIFTIVGGGSPDGRPGSAIPLNLPSDVALDTLGDLYIADTNSHRIRKVNMKTGLMTTIAGNGTVGYSGDGGPATQAALNDPIGIGVDREGNVYIIDTAVAPANPRIIRRIDVSTGIITTIAGGGTGVEAGDGGPATLASLTFPKRLAIDGAGNLYIATSATIRKVEKATGKITTVAGNFGATALGDGGPATLADLSFATGIALDVSGNLYIADRGHFRIRKVDARTGIITTIAGTGTNGLSGDGGPATLANLSFVAGLTIDAAGNLYISDLSRIRKIDASSGIITTIAGNNSRGYSGDGGPATLARLASPEGLTIHSNGDLFVADTGNDVVRRVSAATKIITTFAGTGPGGSFTGDGGSATSAVLSLDRGTFTQHIWTRGVVVSESGDLFVSDTYGHRVRRVDRRTGIITTIAGNGMARFSGDGGAGIAASLNHPAALAIDRSGNLYIGDSLNLRVRKLNLASNTISTIAGDGNPAGSPARGDGGPATQAYLGFPDGLAVDRQNHVYVSSDNRIRKIDADSGIITTFAGGGNPTGGVGDGGPATAARLHVPAHLAFDSKDNLFVAEISTNVGGARVRRIEAGTGIITTVAGQGHPCSSCEFRDGVPATQSVVSPAALALDSGDHLYISDGARIRKVDSSGIIRTIAGTGTFGYSGDGGPASLAGLPSPLGIAIDRQGNLFIADASSNRVRAIYACVAVDEPILVSPANGSTGVATLPRLAWNAARGAFRYDILLDTVNPPVRRLASDSSSTTYAPSNLEPLQTYFWQVIANGDPFCVPFSVNASKVRSFTTKSVCGPPEMIQP